MYPPRRKELIPDGIRSGRHRHGTQRSGRGHPVRHSQHTQYPPLRGIAGGAVHKAHTLPPGGHGHEHGRRLRPGRQQARRGRSLHRTRNRVRGAGDPGGLGELFARAPDHHEYPCTQNRARVGRATRTGGSGRALQEHHQGQIQGPAGGQHPGPDEGSHSYRTLRTGRAPCTWRCPQIFSWSPPRMRAALPRKTCRSSIPDLDAALSVLRKAKQPLLLAGTGAVRANLCQ